MGLFTTADTKSSRAEYNKWRVRTEPIILKSSHRKRTCLLVSPPWWIQLHCIHPHDDQKPRNVPTLFPHIFSLKIDTGANKDLLIGEALPANVLHVANASEEPVEITCTSEGQQETGKGPELLNHGDVHKHYSTAGPNIMNPTTVTVCVQVKGRTSGKKSETYSHPNKSLIIRPGPQLVPAKYGLTWTEDRQTARA